MPTLKKWFTFTPMKNKSAGIESNFKIPKIKLGEVFEVDGNLYVITKQKLTANSSNLTDNRSIYELKLT